MKLTRTNLTLAILIFILVINIFLLTDFQALYIRAILAFIFIITIPGLLIMLMFKIRVGFWEYFVYTIGLSVAFIMFAGLAVNWTLPALGITDKPLSLYPILLCFDIFLLIFIFIAWKRNSDLQFQATFPKLDWLNRIFFIIPIFFPFMAILGAFILNNFGPNYLTMIMLGGIAVYVFMLVLFRKKLNNNIWPCALFLIGLSLLLMWSLRSWHVSGGDISIEYYLFQKSYNQSYWGAMSVNHMYNAMLSVTILPTIILNFLKISPEYTFKLFFIIIFAFATLITYNFWVKIFGKEITFMSSLFFIIQIPFIFWMPMLARQEIAFIFFGLTLLILFNKEINLTFKKTLFLIFGFSMIVSHYSTAYIALGLFTLTYLFSFIYKKWENRKIKKGKLKEKARSQFYLTGILILVLLVFGFLWYSQVTETSNNLISFVGNTIKNTHNFFSEEMKSASVKSIISLNIFKSSFATYTEDVNNYNSNASAEYSNKSGILKYGNINNENYLIMPKFSSNLDTPNPIVQKYVFIYSRLISSLLKLFILVGFIFLSYKFYNHKYEFDYFISNLIFIVLLGLIIILPYFSLDYNLERIFQQTLIILSPLAIIGGLTLLKFLRNDTIKFILITFVLISFLLFNVGFLYQIFGGSPGANLNNFGFNYDQDYTTNTEVRSAIWLADNYNHNLLIYADKVNERKLSAFGSTSTKIVTDILPQTIDKRAYIYLGRANVIEKEVFKLFNGKVIQYNLPELFINDNKNKIYNNGGSEIFK